MALATGSALGLIALGKMLTAAGGVKTGAALGAAAKLGAGKTAVGKLGSKMAASTFGKNFATMMPKTGAEWGMRVAPDAIFGVMAGAMTPGDLGDKLIAGTTATAGGALGGLAARGAVGGVAPKMLTPMLGKHKNPAYNGMMDIGLEMVGGIGGDMAAQGVADGIMRVKGGGMTPYERLAAEQQKELEQDILRRYLSGKGGYPDQASPFGGTVI